MSSSARDLGLYCRAMRRHERDRAVVEDIFAEGAVVLDRFEIHRRLGEGAMSVVYRARDRRLDRDVALKVLRAPAGIGSTVRARFQREARVAALLSHPNAVALFDAGEAKGRFYLVLELVEGRPMPEILADASVGLDEKIRLLEQVARGVAAAHDKGIVHRDLKPANILITPAGEPKVGDFGLARLVDSDLLLTRSGLPLGTPRYMAPEQVCGRPDRISLRSDVYALGAILYEILTGQAAHQGENATDLYARILRDQPPAPRQLNPAVSRTLEAIAMKALEKEPAARYPTASAFADDLKRYLDGVPVQARSLPLLQRALLQARRHPAMAVAAVLLALVLIGAGTVVAVQQWKSERMLALQRKEARRRLEREREDLQRLMAIWWSMTERKRDLRQLRVNPAESLRLIEESIGNVDAYLRDWPEKPQGYFIRALGRILLGDLVAAQKDLRTAVRIEPEFKPGWSLLTMVHCEDLLDRIQDVWGRALIDAEEMIQDGMVEVEETARKTCRPGAEEDEWKRWDLIWTRDDRVFAHLGRAHLRGSKEAIAEAIRLECDDYRAEEYCLWLGALAPERSERIEWYEKAIRIAPGYEKAHYLLGRARAMNADQEAAIRSYTTAIGLRPDYARAYFWRGRSRQRVMDLAGAISDFDRVLEIRKNDADALAIRGQARAAAGDADAALSDLTAAIAIKPDSAEAYFLRGQVLESKGALNDAAVDYETALRKATPHATWKSSMESALQSIRERLDGGPW